MSPEVRLIDENGNQCGVVKIEKALEMANEASLDLVEIAADAKPPVCKILNFGKFKYDRERQKKINKKKQHVVNVKEIRLRPNTDKHDLEIKLNKDLIIFFPLLFFFNTFELLYIFNLKKNLISLSISEK